MDRRIKQLYKRQLEEEKRTLEEGLKEERGTGRTYYELRKEKFPAYVKQTAEALFQRRRPEFPTFEDYMSEVYDELSGVNERIDYYRQFLEPPAALVATEPQPLALPGRLPEFWPTKYTRTELSDFTPLPYEGKEYFVNKVGYVKDAQDNWVGRWNGSTILKNPEPRWFKYLLKDYEELPPPPEAFRKEKVGP